MRYRIWWRSAPEFPWVPTAYVHTSRKQARDEAVYLYGAYRFTRSWRVCPEV